MCVDNSNEDVLIFIGLPRSFKAGAGYAEIPSLSIHDNLSAYERYFFA